MLVGQQLGPFAVEKEIGSGAMGAVFRARYVKNGQVVAIKLMAPSLGHSDTALARFESETAILKQLNHPNIVRLYATGRYKGTPFYAMEFVEGESLDKVQQRRNRLTWEEVVTLGQQLCAGLQHAHEKGIIHRDLKPSNLMLLPNGTLKLTDFGIARDLDQTHLTSTHATVGTAAYMSPEQCKGDRTIGPKSDLYSMGVVFYELLTGFKPFDAETPLEMFQQHVSGTFERPSRRVLDIPVWLDTLVCQLLEKSPDHRPRDAGAVAEALNRIMEKVAAQQSLGVEAVKARSIDRPRGAAKPNEEDREAARELSAAMGKKRGKRRSKPLYRRIWFQALGILIVLAGMIAAMFMATRPANPDTLYRQAQKLMESKDFDDWAKARERDGPIRRYLRHYGDRDDAQTRQIKEWAELVDAVQRERQLNNRMRTRMDAEGPAELVARRAVTQENAGDLETAAATWQSLQKYRQDSDSELKPWGYLADRRLKELKEVEGREKQLLSKLDDKGEFVPGFKPEKNSPEALAADALRNEVLKERNEALKGWEKLKKLTESQSDQRNWFLLASWKVHELGKEKEK